MVTKTPTIPAVLFIKIHLQLYWNLFFLRLSNFTIYLFISENRTMCQSELNASRTEQQRIRASFIALFKHAYGRMALT
ncbi:hypothetical protein IMCC3135_16940 [Granulosicoccus antarcticus IMCC3135]|uniref:Uncharacterized protein n=1 Tax=Granulosicoccus antarcticus IMCC3135 TaxID=1192854 RepID=A0A2Z2NX58_9GAMM|nr:hypothetical protein IMCC3135_16940 [Granulosicoccus antarcticus IMCC3135]